MNNYDEYDDLSDDEYDARKDDYLTGGRPYDSRSWAQYERDQQAYRDNRR